MLKKVILGSLAAAAVGTMVFGWEVMSYVRTSAANVRDAVQSEVPLEFQIDRAQQMVDNLEPDIRKCMEVIAGQQVDIDHLTGEIARKEKAMADQKAAILALRSDLRSGKEKVVYASRSYSPDDIRRDLEKRFERFKSAEETLMRDQQLLDARRTALQANQDKLSAMLTAKQELEVEIAQLEARAKTMEAAESVTSLQIDDSQLNRAKKLITELNRKLDVKEKMLDAEGKFTGLIPVEAVTEGPKSDIGEEIDSYFDREAAGDTQDTEIVLEPSA